MLNDDVENSENSDSATKLVIDSCVENGNKNRTELWKNNGYFASQGCEFFLEKRKNLPTNTIFLCKSFLFWFKKENKKTYLNDLFIVQQIR